MFTVWNRLSCVQLNSHVIYVQKYIHTNEMRFSRVWARLALNRGMCLLYALWVKSQKSSHRGEEQNLLNQIQKKTRIERTECVCVCVFFTAEAVYPLVCRTWSLEGRDQQHVGRWDGTTGGWWHRLLRLYLRFLYRGKVIILPQTAFKYSIKQIVNGLLEQRNQHLHQENLHPRTCQIDKSLTFLRLLLGRGLRGHVDGGSSHADWAASRDQVELHGLPGDEGSCHLHVLRQAQVGAEAGHEVSGGDEVHARLQSLQDELKAAADLFLGNPGHSTDLLTRRNYSRRWRWYQI